MSLEDSIIDAARRAVASAFAEQLANLRTELGRPRMISLKAAPVNHRLLLAAERAGELEVFRVGHAALVDEAALYAFIRRAGSKAATPKPEAADEIAELIAIGDRRRSARGGSK